MLRGMTMLPVVADLMTRHLNTRLACKVSGTAAGLDS